jgi:hypothetical protein
MRYVELILRDARKCALLRMRHKGLRRVVGLFAVEDALQGIEVPLRRGWALVEAGPADVPLGLLDHGGWELL